MRQFIRFAIAGTIGFLVDSGVLYAMLALGTGLYVGRLISFLCAAFVTWRINRRFTFTKGHRHSAWREWYEYLVAMIFGGLCNYGAYVLAMRALPHSGTGPLIAVAIGSIAGMFVNFATARLWVYRPGKSRS
jgi:putative flippase GtrA